MARQSLNYRFKNKIKEENLFGKVSEKKESYYLLVVIMICLGRFGDNNYLGILKLLDILLSSEKKPKEKNPTD